MATLPFSLGLSVDVLRMPREVPSWRLAERYGAALRLPRVEPW